MAIRMGKDDVFEATGSALQFLGNRARPNDIQGRVTVRQPAAVQHAVTGGVEGLLDQVGRSGDLVICRGRLPAPYHS